MKSFNQELKSALVAEIRKHREQDQVIQGNYGYFEEGKFRGCAVGCAIDSLFRLGGNILPHYPSGDHGAYERELGIPKILAELQDVIHEGLSDESFPTWPERFMEAVPTETELSIVFPKFAWWLSYYLLKCYSEDKVAIVVGQLLRACSPVGIRKDIDKALRGADTVLGGNEQFYEKCAEKLIELLKAEGNERI